MNAREHLRLCESKRGGATAEERALCAELEVAEREKDEAKESDAVHFEAMLSEVKKRQAAEARCKRLAVALRAMLDEQNGAPLIRREAEWKKAVDDAAELLVKEEA